MDTTPFTCLDFESGEVALACRGNSFEICISPYSLLLTVLSGEKNGFRETI